ncbi:uncharacterized protein LY89DRAFT_277563 [Mollisia scopiformis]|uniref:Uncharacterized protein n=1 Tax=Mollisia scopiformis TaxID=149040 RepID=A0A132BBK1_MOLSC|nr:uncharacterized protein LY89DRAFT_277563 [Mollisia scopiformis]KUJ09800.1 hypothetical protein LY89DRAFT_277563 [Mollisia scopiformis]
MYWPHYTSITTVQYMTMVFITTYLTISRKTTHSSITSTTTLLSSTIVEDRDVGIDAVRLYDNAGSAPAQLFAEMLDGTSTETQGVTM